MLLKVALNGARSKTEHTNIPHSLDEIEKEVSSVYRLGLKIFHVHCYDKHGKESLKPEDVNALVTQIKRLAPYIQIGISSGDWIEPDPVRRISYIRSWDSVPDFVSVNMIEDEALDCAKALIARGIPIEAGLNEKKAAEIFVRSNLTNYCCRVLIEPEATELAPALAEIHQIERTLDAAGINVRRLLHGFDAAAWPLLRIARERGYDGRMGIEDTLYLENGRMATGNTEIIAEAIRILGDTSLLSDS